MIQTLVLLGATGDLAGRLLLPALAGLRAQGRLPDGLRVLGAAEQEWDDDGFRRHAAQRLEQHAGNVPDRARRALLEACTYRPVDLTDPRTVAPLVAGPAPVAAYLALPPSAFPDAVRALGAAGLPEGSRLVVEKPFGDDLAGAVALDALLEQTVREPAAYRVDHALGLPALQGLVALRRADAGVEAAWDARHVAQVDLLWEETLGVPGRTEFYDRAGALRDVVQNHLLQVLSVVATDLPHQGRGEREGALAVLRACRVVSSRRARYTAGRAGGVDLPDYTAEPGVARERDTETWAELVVEVDTPRWAGTRFVLRAGKALDGQRRSVVVRPRSGSVGGVVDLDGPDDEAVRLRGGAPATPSRTGEREAYARVLLDVLERRSALSVPAAATEQAWRVVTPVLQHWQEGRVPLEEYAAGSPGPQDPRR